MLKDGTRLGFLPGAHSPGAMMIRVTGSDGTQILYPGDYCQSNRYDSEEPSTLCNLFNAEGGAKFLLVDGTFLGQGPKTTEGEGDRITAALLEAHDGGRPIVFSAESLDYLHAAYIWYFKPSTADQSRSSLVICMFRSP
jgi:Cft2 family RNA processing exonuclease